MQTPIFHSTCHVQNIKKQHHDARVRASMIVDLSDVQRDLSSSFDECELPTTPRDKPIIMIEKRIKDVRRDLYGFGK